VRGGLAASWGGRLGGAVSHPQECARGDRAKTPARQEGLPERASLSARRHSACFAKPPKPPCRSRSASRGRSA
jgi:hypothetical protein